MSETAWRTGRWFDREPDDQGEAGGEMRLPPAYVAYNQSAMTDHTSPINGPLDEDSGSLVVPLFPLPNVVLFPKAVLPLHIFEERYKAMTADALSGHRRIAMALLQRGWERDYYSRPMVEPIVCVGQILQ